MTTIKKRRWSDPLVYTHILFVANCALYASKYYWIICIVLLSNTIFSLLYHLSYEKDEVWCLYDQVSCRVSLACLFCYLIKYCSIYEIGCSVLWVLISLSVLELGRVWNYPMLHTIWHFMVFAGNIMLYCFLPIYVV